MGLYGDVHAQKKRSIPQVAAAYRCGLCGIAYGSYPYMQACRQGAAGRIEADPAPAGQIDFSSGMRGVRGDIRLCVIHAAQITADKACREAHVPGSFHEQQGEIPARAGAGSEGFAW